MAFLMGVFSIFKLRRYFFVVCIKNVYLHVSVNLNVSYCAFLRVKIVLNVLHLSVYVVKWLRILSFSEQCSFRIASISLKTNVMAHLATFRRRIVQINRFD